jgi:hypothetical protein
MVSPAQLRRKWTASAPGRSSSRRGDGTRRRPRPRMRRGRPAGPSAGPRWRRRRGRPAQPATVGDLGHRDEEHVLVEVRLGHAPGLAVASLAGGRRRTANRWQLRAHLHRERVRHSRPLPDPSVRVAPPLLDPLDHRLALVQRAPDAGV